MIHNLHFRMPEVKIRISQRCTQFNVVLHLDNKEEYSADFRDQSWGMGLKQGVSSIYSMLSYIDHVLAHQIEHTRGSSGNTIGIRRRPQWTPPDSARYSYFDSAIQLSDGSPRESESWRKQHCQRPLGTLRLANTNCFATLAITELPPAFEVVGHCPVTQGFLESINRAVNLPHLHVSHFIIQARFTGKRRTWKMLS
jgi:hypothetical protein